MLARDIHQDGQGENLISQLQATMCTACKDIKLQGGGTPLRHAYTYYARTKASLIRPYNAQ